MEGKKNTYNKKRYEDNKELILKTRREKYALLNKNQPRINMKYGNFVLNFD